jgi:hypothetical protein
MFPTFETYPEDRGSMFLRNVKKPFTHLHGVRVQKKIPQIVNRSVIT